MADREFVSEAGQGINTGRKTAVSTLDRDYPKPPSTCGGLWPGAGSHGRQLSGHPTWLSAVERPVRAPGYRWPTRSRSSDPSNRDSQTRLSMVVQGIRAGQPGGIYSAMPALRKPVSSFSRRCSSRKILKLGKLNVLSGPIRCRLRKASFARARSPASPAAAAVTHHVKSQSGLAATDSAQRVSAACG